MTNPRLTTLILATLAAAALVSGCGNAHQSAKLRAERNAAIRRAHAGFAIPPCSLLSVAQVSAVLGVRAHKETARAGCVYTGTTGGDRRSLTVTPSKKPVAGQLISPAIKHPVTISGPGFRGRAGSTPTLGDVSVPTSAVAGMAAGDLYVSLLVEDANPNAPSQLFRVVALAHKAGPRLVAAAH